MPSYQRICPICQQSYLTKRCHSKTCSTRCRMIRSIQNRPLSPQQPKPIPTTAGPPTTPPAVSIPVKAETSVKTVASLPPPITAFSKPVEFSPALLDKLQVMLQDIRHLVSIPLLDDTVSHRVAFIRSITILTMLQNVERSYYCRLDTSFFQQLAVHLPEQDVEGTYRLVRQYVMLYNPLIYDYRFKHEKHTGAIAHEKI